MVYRHMAGMPAGFHQYPVLVLWAALNKPLLTICHHLPGDNQMVAKPNMPLMSDTGSNLSVILPPLLGREEDGRVINQTGCAEEAFDRRFPWTLKQTYLTLQALSIRFVLLDQVAKCFGIRLVLKIGTASDPREARGIDERFTWRAVVPTAEAWIREKTQENSICAA